MKARVIDYKASDANEYEYRVNLVVRYGKKSYAVTITTYHDFNENKNPYVKYINSFGYLSTVATKSAARDKSIREAIKGMEFSF